LSIVTITLTDILAARARLAPYLTPTPVEPAPGLGARAWLKLENCNRTHSFKVRGALNAMLALSAEARARGIVTASSGNHAQGIAYAAALLGVHARIYMSKRAAPRKIAGGQRHGGDLAQAVLFGESYDEAEHEARRVEREEGLTYISPYNDPLVVAGNGTVGLEIYDALPLVRRVIVPVGGGGLISGIAVALKSHDPTIEVIGVNPAVSPDMYNYFNHAALPINKPTLADALPGEIERESITRGLVQRYVDQLVVVEESAIAAAIRWMIAEPGWLAEGGGVVGVAALQSGAVAPLDDEVTCVVISGGNVGVETLKSVLAM
jgi:threonine dehydratase